MSSWSPSRLPRIRDRLHTLLTDPHGVFRSVVPNPGPDVVHMAQHVAGAALYWVAPDMAALAVNSATTIPTVRWTVADRPAPVGLLVYDDGVGAVTMPGVDDIPVDAVSWGPHPGGMLLSLFVARERVNRWLQGRGTIPGDVAPLLPVAGQVLPVTGDWCPAAELAANTRTLLTTVSATWALMAQPLLVERTPTLVDRKTRTAYGRAGRRQPDVTLVDVRRRYRPQQDRPGPDADGGSGRRLRYRSVVTGYWRQQPYGPGGSLRRLQYVPFYWRGPDGAPLLKTTRVNVWRR